MRFWIRHPSFQSCCGFTLAEFVVVMGIMTAISALALSSFTGLHERTAVGRSARELALLIRRAQNMSFAVTRTQASPASQPAVGVVVKQGSGKYFLFADRVADNRYVDGQDTKIRFGETEGDYTLPGGVKVSAIIYFQGPDPFTTNLAHILFSPPEATVSITGNDGASLNDFLEITLISSSGDIQRKLTVRASGEISIK